MGDNNQDNFCESLSNLSSIFAEELSKLKKENEKLKEENEKLMGWDNSNFTGFRPARVRDWGEKLSKLKKENEELKDENEKLKITDETCLTICGLIEDELPDNYTHDDIIQYIKGLLSARVVLQRATS